MSSSIQPAPKSAMVLLKADLIHHAGCRVGDRPVVVPGSGAAPSTVKNLVITPPSSTPQLVVRVAAPTYLGRGLMGFGPAFTYALSGTAGRSNLTTKTGRAGLETWVYYFPTQECATSLRLGAAPFVSYRTHGSDAFGQWEYGALLQVRVGTAALEF